MATRIANTAASILNQTVLTAAQAQAITGLKTFNRSPSAPFAVQAGSAKVANLDADLLDGQTGSYYNDVANLTGTTLPSSIVASSLTSVGTITSGIWNAGALTSTGPLIVNGVSISHAVTGGANSPQSLLLQNTTSGTAAQAAFGVSAGSVNGAVTTYSQGYTTASYAIQASTTFYGDGAGGVSIVANNAAGVVRFYTGGATLRFTLDAAGQLNAAGAAGLSVTPSGYYMTTWPTTASAANARVDNANYVQLVTSLRAHKHDERPITLGDARRTILALHPVLYKSRVDEDQRDWAGFIADDAVAVNPVLVTYDDRGALQSFTYDRVPAYLVPLAQDHEARLVALETRLLALEAR